MAYVIHDGKRYRFSMPYQGKQFSVNKYSPAPDKSGVVTDGDFLIFIVENEGKLEIENDGEDALEIERELMAYQKGEITASQIDDKLAAIVQEIIGSQVNS